MADVEAALRAHERIKRSTELPLFYGRKDKDTITAHLLIERFEKAANIANWDNDLRRCEEFYMILRDRALLWWDSLSNFDNVNRENWEHVKREFLAAYVTKYTPKTNCANFAELVQRTSGETVNDYYLRITETMKRINDAKPAALNDVRMALPVAMNAANARNLKAEGIVDMNRFFLLQLFMAGLKEDVRLKVMEGGHETLQAALAAAREIETILNDRKGYKTHVTAIEGPDSDGQSMSKETDKTEEEEQRLIEEINLIRSRQGKAPIKWQKGKNGNMTCWYCHKKGHMQLKCFKRKRENGQMVDQQGKPLPNQVKAIQEQTETEKLFSLGAINDASLNW
jgi:hypothetical protein